jgi:predicted Fe-Mo cluster-binding NifX family protein
MKIAITAKDTTLDADMDPRFGRTCYFVLVDPDTMAFEAVPNEQSFNLPQGAGIQAGQTLVRHGANVLITGNCGPKAFQVLRQAGIEVVLCGAVRVREAVEQYRKGLLRPTADANVDGHWI